MSSLLTRPLPPADLGTNGIRQVIAWGEESHKRGIGIDIGAEERLTNVRFADDISLIGGGKRQISAMLEELSAEAESVGLQIHLWRRWHQGTS